MPESFKTSQTETRPDGTTIETTLTITLSDDPTPYDGEAEGDFEDVEPESKYVVTFKYDGQTRVVENPIITRGAWHYRRGFNTLLSGVELSRDGEDTVQFKHFSLDKIKAL